MNEDSTVVTTPFILIRVTDDKGNILQIVAVSCASICAVKKSKVLSRTHSSSLPATDSFFNGKKLCNIDWLLFLQFKLLWEHIYSTEKMFFCHYYWKFFYGTKGTTYQSSDQNVIHKSRYWRVFGVPVYVNIFQTKIKWKNLFIPPCFKLDTTAMESFHEIHLIRVLYSTTLRPCELNNQVWVEIINSCTEAQIMLV